MNDERDKIVRQCAEKIEPYLHVPGSTRVDPIIADALDRYAEGLRFKPYRVKVKDGWYEAGRAATVLGPDVFAEQNWTPLLWDDGDDDPDYAKAACLIRIDDSAMQAETKDDREENL